MGNLRKDETRQIAKNLDLNVAHKPDSQDICFVPNGNYASVIQKFRPDSFKKGNIKDLHGNVIGVHDEAANVPIVVAINKCDLPEADPQKIKNQLLEHELIAEDLSGDTLMVEISAKKKMNLD